MAKQAQANIQLDDEAINSQESVVVPVEQVFKKEQREVPTKKEDSPFEGTELVNCLKNEKIIVRFLAKARGMITDPRHILYGGMAPRSKVRVTVPMLRSGGYTDVLTKAEKEYLEYALGLEPNALSVHRRTDNFWDDANLNGIGRVELIKGDNKFDLSDPLDYIRVKILKANTSLIAPSMQELSDRPKATYKFVIISEKETSADANMKVTNKAQAYMEFGRIRDDKDKMRVIIETLDGRPTASNNTVEFLQAKIGELLEANVKTFLQVVKDPYLDNKVLIRRAIDAGIISNRGNYLYLRDTDTPLCSDGQHPTLSVAAKYLSLPRNQELKFTIEAKLKN